MLYKLQGISNPCHQPSFDIERNCKINAVLRCRNQKYKWTEQWQYHNIICSATMSIKSSEELLTVSFNNTS